MIVAFNRVLILLFLVTFLQFYYTFHGNKIKIMGIKILLVVNFCKNGVLKLKLWGIKILKMVNFCKNGVLKYKLWGINILILMILLMIFIIKVKYFSKNARKYYYFHEILSTKVIFYNFF